MNDDGPTNLKSDSKDYSDPNRRRMGKYERLYVEFPSYGWFFIVLVSVVLSFALEYINPTGLFFLQCTIITLALLVITPLLYPSVMSFFGLKKDKDNNSVG